MKFPVIYCVIHRGAIFWRHDLALILPRILTCDATNDSLWLPPVYVYVACCWLYYFDISVIYAAYLLFSKCSFRRHSAYFHSTLYRSSCRKKNLHQIFRKLPFDNFPHSAFRIPQNTPSLPWQVFGIYHRRTQRIRLFSVKFSLNIANFPHQSSVNFHVR